MLHISPGLVSKVTSPYLSIVAMLVESYVLDAAWSLVTATSYALHVPSDLLFQTNDSTIKVRGFRVALMVSLLTQLLRLGHCLLSCCLSR